MFKLNKKALLGFILLGSSNAQSIPNWLKKTGHVFSDYGLSCALGINSATTPSLFATIKASENANKYSFNTLNKKIPIAVLAASLTLMSYGFQTFDFEFLGPKTGYVTGIEVPLAYWSLYQISTWLDKFENKELPWQKEDGEPEGEENV